MDSKIQADGGRPPIIIKLQFIAFIGGIKNEANGNLSDLKGGELQNSNRFLPESTGAESERVFAHSNSWVHEFHGNV